MASRCELVAFETRKVMAMIMAQQESSEMLKSELVPVLNQIRFALVSLLSAVLTIILGICGLLTAILTFVGGLLGLVMWILLVVRVGLSQWQQHLQKEVLREQRTN